MKSPFIVGVLGHPDLHETDIALLREKVGTLMSDLKEHLPNTEVRFILASDEGTDQLVAQTARAHGVSVETADTSTMIRRCGLLLALWDGHPSPDPDDTAGVVLHYLGARPDGGHADSRMLPQDEVDELDTAEHVVYWAPVARITGTPVHHGRRPGYLRSVGEHHLHMQPHIPAPLAHRLEGLNNYNREIEELSATGRIRSRDSLLASLPPGAAIDERMMLQQIDTQYGMADALAVHYQLRSDRLFQLFGVMAFTMGLAYLVYEKFGEWDLLLMIYLIVLLSSVALYYALRGRQWFTKHLSYRVLAETMRAQFYLRLAEVDRQVDAARVLALSGIENFEGFGLIHLLLSAVETRDPLPSSGGGQEAERLLGVEQTWIGNQHSYFVSKVARLERSARRVKIMQQIMFVVILLVIVTMFLFDNAIEHIDIGFGVTLKNFLTFWMGFLALVLGIWQLHEHKMASRELLWQYRNQRDHFARAMRQLKRLSSSERRRQVIAELGRVSLMESYLWTIHRYHREHEPPGAG